MLQLHLNQNSMAKNIALFFCVTCVTLAQAQDTLREPFTVSIYANLGFASSELKDAVNNTIDGTGLGFGANALFNLNGKQQSPSPVGIGMDMEYFFFGRDKIEGTGSAPPYKTSFNLWHWSGITRLILSKRSTGFVPFVDGSLGVKIFNVRTKIDKDVLNYVLGDKEEDIIGVKNYTGLGYGVGFGFFTRKPREYGNGASFSLRFMYLWGDEVKYIKRGTMQVDNSGNLTFETGYTNTNMVLIQLGVTLH
jgi:hypothetical protein